MKVEKLLLNDLLKNLKKKSVFEILANFLILAFFTTLYNRGPKNQFWVQIASAGKNPSVILTIRICLKPESVLNLLEFANHVPSETHVPSISENLDYKIIYPSLNTCSIRSINSRTRVFNVCQTITLKNC